MNSFKFYIAAYSITASVLACPALAKSITEPSSLEEANNTIKSIGTHHPSAKKTNVAGSSNLSDTRPSKSMIRNALQGNASRSASTKGSSQGQATSTGFNPNNIIPIDPNNGDITFGSGGEVSSNAAGHAGAHSAAPNPIKPGIAKYATVSTNTTTIPGSVLNKARASDALKKKLKEKAKEKKHLHDIAGNPHPKSHADHTKHVSIHVQEAAQAATLD